MCLQNLREFAALCLEMLICFGAKFGKRNFGGAPIVEVNFIVGEVLG